MQVCGQAHSHDAEAHPECTNCLDIFSWQSPQMALEPYVELLIHSLAWKNKLLMKHSLTVKENNMLLKFDLHSLAAFGHGDDGLFQWDDCCFAPGK